MALWLAILLLVTVLLSYGMIIHSTHHDCSGVECKICLQLEQVRQSFSKMKILSIVLFIMVLVRIFLLSYINFDKVICIKNTLILLKVELLN